MKVAYVIFTREKAHLAAALERCVRSAFAQTYAPMEIILSDQGSQDGTKEILARLASEYTGPNVVRVLDCPRTERRGMAGMNDHLDWLHETLDCDIVIPSASDDYAEPQRAARLVEAFEATGADMVGAAMRFENPVTGEIGRSSYQREGWVSMRDMVEHKVGGSSAAAHRRDLWERVKPIPDVCGNDVWLPPVACALGGFWYVNEPLYTYVQHADPSNTGLEGVRKALPEAERRPIDELRFYQTAASWRWVYRKLEELGAASAEAREWVKEMMLVHTEAWIEARTEMTLARVAPKLLTI